MEYHWGNVSGEVQRLSTPSWKDSFRRLVEPYVTQWLWYWQDEHKVWQQYDQTEKIEEAFVENRSQFTFTVAATTHEYKIYLKGTGFATVDLKIV